MLGTVTAEQETILILFVATGPSTSKSLTLPVPVAVHVTVIDDPLFCTIVPFETVQVGAITIVPGEMEYTYVELSPTGDGPTIV